MPDRLASGAPYMTVADVADRAWLTVIGCDNGHSRSPKGPELVKAFKPRTTLEQLSERLTCGQCGSRDGRIGFVQDTSPDALARGRRKDMDSAPPFKGR